jgi:hypothetical protein
MDQVVDGQNRERVSRVGFIMKTQSRLLTALMVAGLAALPGLMAPADAATSPALAQPTLAQAQGVDKALGSAPVALKSDVTAAMPTLRPDIVTLMCVEDDPATRGLIEKFVGSRGTAEDSGESYLWKNVVHKEPDGTWLIA